MRNTIGFLSLVLLLSCYNPLRAQDRVPTGIMAQKLVDELLTKHQPALLAVGLHAVAPGATDMTIVAATAREKIGQKSSPTDLHVMERGFPVLEMKGGTRSTVINGVVIESSFLTALHDRMGNTIGMLVLGLKFTTGEETEAARLSRSIQQELESQIPNKAALFKRTQ
ncbi:MAG TPA: hypothetical protein VHZ55_17545 [Bryobacteraceae bacterium]|nr:hypothetical protein [Bryobacteraceae bacterium]